MRSWAVAAWVLSAILVTLTVSDRAAAEEPINTQIDKERREFEQVRKDIETQKRKAREMGRKAGSVLNQMEQIDTSLTAKEKERRLTLTHLSQKDQEIRKIEQEVRRVDAILDKQRETVADRLRAVYKQERVGVFGWLLTAKEPHDLLRRALYIRRIARADQDLFRGFTTNLEVLKGRQEELGHAREAFLEAKKRADRTIAEIQRDRTAKERLLGRIQAEKSLREKTLAELEESSRRIQDLVQSLERQRKAMVGRASPPTTKPAGFVRGGLAWPSDGKVVAAFGRQRHPKFDFPVFRKGIEIAADSSGMVRAAFEGIISYADWFRGYGLLVIIDHGENYYSLYGHNAKLFVSVGDRVATGQVIGEVGDTGLSEGRTVYFEIRRGPEAVNPLEWLRAR